MTAGPTPNKVLLAAAAAVWLVHGIATGEASALDVVLAMTVVAALLWPEPVPGRETIDPLPRVLAGPTSTPDGWPPGYRHTLEQTDVRSGHGWARHGWADESGRSSKGHPSAEAARISAHRDAAQQLARNRSAR